MSGESRQSGRRMRAIVLWPSLGAIVLAAVLLVQLRGDPPQPSADMRAPVAEAPAVSAAPPPAADEPGPALRAAADPEEDPGEGMFDASAMAWSRVDLDEVREALPDNSYWRRSAPTDDPEVLRRREEERAYWDEQYGKVLSNTATEEEVRAYYAHRRDLSTDAIEFSNYLLDEYGDVLPERDVGLLQLASELHLARLEELPRNLSDALERREEHARRREEWLAQEKLFDE